jgi:hypothetical protein
MQKRTRHGLPHNRGEYLAQSFSVRQCHCVLPKGRPTTFGKGLCPDELTDGFASHPKASRNFMQTHTLLMECSDGFIAGIPIGPARLGVRFSVNRRRPSLWECGRHVAKVVLVFQLLGCLRSSSFLEFPACFLGNGISSLLFHFR